MDDFDDNYSMLLDLGWWYKPYVLSKEARSVSFLPKEVKLNFYECEFLPPEEQWN